MKPDTSAMPESLRRSCPLVLAFSALMILAGCATTPASRGPEIPARHTVAEIDDERVAFIPDPWQRFNRRMYRFNYNFDRYVYLPVVNAYETIVPNFMQTGVSNFFNNLADFRSMYNSLLQGKGGSTGDSFGRFVANTTVGVGGLFDVATPMGIQKHNEDFGQTLGVWGAGPGPYVVLPILGPNTVRSTAGFAVDTGVSMAITNRLDPWQGSDGHTAEVVYYSLKAIDLRHQENFRYFESGYPFEYYIVRFLYRQKREFAIMK